MADNAHGLFELDSWLLMNFFRTRRTAAVAWGMIPLALWAGLPSTACVCANGRLKLVCRHVAGGPAGHHAAHLSSAADAGGCHSCCCEGHDAVTEFDSDRDADCCGGGVCCYGASSREAGVGSKACCKPILTAPSVAPESTNVACDQTPALGDLVEDLEPLARASFSRDVAEVDTGPPLDRVIVFRSLLI